MSTADWLVVQKAEHMVHATVERMDVKSIEKKVEERVVKTVGKMAVEMVSKRVAIVAECLVLQLADLMVENSVVRTVVGKVYMKVH